MADLLNLDDLSGVALTEVQILGIIARIDLNIVNMLGDGKMSTTPYDMHGSAGRSADRARGIESLLKSKAYYEKLLEDFPCEIQTQYYDPSFRDYPGNFGML